jgi:hypothetical protein
MELGAESLGKFRDQAEEMSPVFDGPLEGFAALRTARHLIRPPVRGVNAELPCHVGSPFGGG